MKAIKVGLHDLGEMIEDPAHAQDLKRHLDDTLMFIHESLTEDHEKVHLAVGAHDHSVIYYIAIFACVTAAIYLLVSVYRLQVEKKNEKKFF